VPTVIHSIHFPVSARNFIEPMVAHLNQHGIASELWFENHPRHAAVIQQVRAPHRFVDSDLSLNPFVFTRRVGAYRRQLRGAHPRVLHVHQTRASVVPLLAARIERVPVRVYHNHGLPYLGHRGLVRWLLRTLERINFRLATHVLLVSRSNLDAARADGLLPRDKGTVPASGSAAGIDLAEFVPERFDAKAKKVARATFGIGDAAFVLAYVGRPVKRKGFRVLLSAWEKSGLGGSGNVLLMAGCTAEECARATGGVNAGVKGLGYLADLREFYAASDTVVLPSDHEGFPYSLLEGAAAGRALIGTDIPGIRCAIRHDETGALGNAIGRLASDAALRERLGRNARARVEREFSREMVLRSLLDFYRTELL
jgi:glycosyltransferase involved in cell wall biosynthesis